MDTIFAHPYFDENAKGTMKTHILWMFVCAIVATITYSASQRPARVVEKPVEVVKEVPVEKIVEKPVEVVKEVPVENVVVKLINVPVPIPPSFEAAKAFCDAYFDAEVARGKDVLKGIEDVTVQVEIDDDIKDSVGKDQLTDSIELSLRRNGIKVSDESIYVLTFFVSGLWMEKEHITYVFSARLSLEEIVRLYRPPGFKKTVAEVWCAHYDAYAGSKRIREGVTEAAEDFVTKFSNQYLAANGK